MVKRTLLALFLLLIASASLFAITFGAGEHVNLVYINVWLDGQTLHGTTYFSQMVFIRDTDWHSDVITGHITENAYASGVSGPLDANEQLIVDYYDYSAEEFRNFGTALTDADGNFQINLDASILQEGHACTRVKVRYEGNGPNQESETETTYCRADYNLLPFGAIGVETCFPVFVILGILVGAMYASGTDPLKAFDLSTPRLPSPKSKPMVGSSPYLPGWKVQRLGQLRLSRDYGRGLDKQLDLMIKELQMASGSTLPMAAGQANLLRVYNRERTLIEQIKQSRHLSVVQRSMLIELLLLGKERYFKDITGGEKGVDKDTLRAYLASGNRKELERISKQMEEVWNTNRVGDVRLMIKEEVGKYEREQRTMTDTQRRMNEPAYKAWNTLTWISGMDIDDGKMYAGSRQVKEKADYTFDVSRKWVGLGGRVGKFLATTPGLRGEFATAVGSVRMITGIYGRILRTVAVDGIARNVTGQRDGGPAAGRENAVILDRLSQSNKTVGNLGNGFEGMSLMLRDIVAELKRRKLLSDKEAKDILSESEKLYRESSEVLSQYMLLNKRSISSREKESRLAEIRNNMRSVQKRYEQLLSKPEFSKALEAARKTQEDEESGGTRNSELAKRVVGTMTDKMAARDLTQREFERMMNDLKSAKQKLSGSSSADAFEAAEFISLFTQKTLESVKQHSGEFASMRNALGGRYRDKVDANTKPEDIILTRFYNKVAELTNEDLQNVRQALKALERSGLSKRYKNFAEVQARLRFTEKEMVKLESELESAKRAGDKSPTSPSDFVGEHGYLGNRSVEFLNRYLQKSGYEKANPRDTIISKEEMDELRREIRKRSAGSDSESDRLRQEVQPKVMHVQRAKLTGRIEKMLKEGRTRELEGMLQDVSSENWAAGSGGLGGYESKMGQYFSVGNRLTKKDIMGTEEREAVLNNYRGIMTDARLNEKEKAQRMADIMIESFPWYRKMKNEYFEEFIRAQSNEFKRNIRGGAPEDIENRNFLGVNIREADRRLNMWRLSNEEILERGLVPGGAISHEEAAKSGAWLTSPIGYWIPLTATRQKRAGASSYEVGAEEQRRQKRDEEMDKYIRQNLSEAERIVYGYLDKDQKTIKETKDEKGVFGGTRYLNWWEKAWMSGLHDLGAEALTVKASVTDLWQTLEDMKARYGSLQMYNTRTEQFLTTSQVKAMYIQSEFAKKQRVIAEMDEHLSELNARRESARSEDERKQIDKQIKEQKRFIREQSDYNKKLLRALTFDASIFDVLSRKRGDEPREYDMSGLPFYEKIDLMGRQKYGQDLKDFDPVVARLMKTAERGAYELGFLGIIPVRSGRATSSLYGEWGLVATGGSHFGPAMMNPRRYNWVTSDWSEADVWRGAYGGPAWQQNIPFLRQVTYGNLMRTLSLPGISVSQQISAATSQFELRSSGVPSPWEPQYVDYSNYSAGTGTLAQAVLHFFPPFTLLTYPGLWLNPAKDGWFARSKVGEALHVGDIKYGLYSAYSRMGGKNYTMAGVTGKDDWRAGGPSNWMAYADKFYTSTYSHGYPPAYFIDSHRRINMFPVFNRNMARNAPGYYDEHADRALPDIYRRETTAVENLYERKSYVEGVEKRFGDLWGPLTPFTTPGFVYNLGKVGLYQPIAAKITGNRRRQGLCQCGQKGRHLCPLRGGRVYEEV